ncbi:MAG: class II fructose-bisphosphate aldolase [bacterium]
MNRDELKKLYARTAREGWALGQFNAENLEFVQAIVRAAHDERSPVIIAASPKTLDYLDAATFAATVSGVARSEDVRPVLHLDHGENPEMVADVLEAGFTSVMFDGSSLPFEENVRITTEVVKLAHARNAFTEAELGHVGGKPGEQAAVEPPLTDPEKAEEFVAKTGVDSLAIAVGTSHGAYKFQGEPYLDLERITAIAARVHVPLVLHGASGVDLEAISTINRYGGAIQGASGLGEELYREAVRRGIRKVNVATELRLAFLAALRQTLGEDPRVIDPRIYLGEARDAVAETVRAKMRLLGSSGRVG